MSPEEVKRLAAAIAKVNGHPEPHVYGEQVAAEWDQRKRDESEKLKEE